MRGAPKVTAVILISLCACDLVTFTPLMALGMAQSIPFSPYAMYKNCSDGFVHGKIACQNQ